MFRHTPPWFRVSHRDAGVCDPEVEFTEADTLFISWSCWAVLPAGQRCEDVPVLTTAAAMVPYLTDDGGRDVRRSDVSLGK